MQNAGYHTYFSGKSFNGFTWNMHCKFGCLEGLDEADIALDPSTYLYYNTSWAHYDGSKWTQIKGMDPPSGLYSTDQISDNVGYCQFGEPTLDETGSIHRWLCCAIVYLKTAADNGKLRADSLMHRLRISSGKSPRLIDHSLQLLLRSRHTFRQHPKLNTKMILQI